MTYSFDGLECLEAYGFWLEEIVSNKISLTDENGNTVPKNTKLKIVAIAPKVCHTPKILIEKNPKEFDSKEYFVNLVRADQEKNYGNRFRVHFVTIEKV